MLLDEFDRSSNYTISRTLFLFCQDNDGFVLPDRVNTTFIEGIRHEEVRAFGLRYGSKARTSDDAKRQNASTKNDMVRKAEFEKLVLKLSLITEKTYCDTMVKQINSRIKGGLSYDDILEMFIVAGNTVD